MPLGKEISLALLSLVVWLAYRFYRYAVVKCRLNGLRGPPAVSWAKGNLGQIYDPWGMEFHLGLQEKYGSAVKIHGLFGDEHIYFSDTLALQQILVKEPQNFDETVMFLEGNKLIFGESLSSIVGEQHKRQRKLLNPVFATSHLRALTPTFHDIARVLCKRLSTRIDRRGNRIDVLDLLVRTALELVGQCGVGHSFNALDEDEDKMDDWGKALRNLIPTIFALQVERQMIPAVAKLGPAWFRRMLIPLYPKKALCTLRDMSDVMWATSKQILDEKKMRLSLGEKAIGEIVGKGKDIISVLMQENQIVSSQDRMTEAEVIGQMSSILVAATDTTSTTIARILQLLSQRPELQDSLRLEINGAKEGRDASKRDLEYEELNSLPLLDAICRETLRLYSPVTFLSRTCRKASIVSLSRPVTLEDGTTTCQIPVATNQNVIIGVAAANRDPLVWGQDAAEWKPERWLVKSKVFEDAPDEKVYVRVPESAQEAKLPGVYSGMMTFLGGARACVGFKFAEMEMKVVLAALLVHFEFSKTEDEVVWRLGAVQTPLVKGDGRGPQLPLTVVQRTVAGLS